MNNQEIYIFGASMNGGIAHRICLGNKVSVRAFIDNYSDKPSFLGCPVIRPAQADRSIPVLITSQTYPLDIRFQLERLGFQKYMNLSQFRHGLGLEPDWSGDFDRNHEEYGWTRKRLEDAASTTVFDAIMKYRNGFDNFYPAMVRSGAVQWFDPEFFVPGPHVYVDGGAYNGDTGETFAECCPGYSSMYLFEPSSNLAAKAKERLFRYRDVTVVNAGLSDKMEQAHLENPGLSSGCVGTSGEKTMLLRLDDYLTEAPTLIKLDVEGCEKAATLGAEQHIRQSKPMLAIAVYHRPEDIWEIPRVISGMRSDYKFYLRHYTQFYHETVLYCI